MRSSFTERLVLANHLDEQGFQSWFLRPGMLFSAERIWWGDEETRPRPHEGLDLSAFIDSNGDVASLEAGAKVPVLFGGQVVAIFADFLGQSILVAHQQQEGGRRFYSIYAHVVAEAGIVVGHHCDDSVIIARIAKSKKAGVPAHLHLSTLWLSGTLSAEMSWPKIDCSTNIFLCDPLKFINGYGQNHRNESHEE